MVLAKTVRSVVLLDLTTRFLGLPGTFRLGRSCMVGFPVLLETFGLRFAVLGLGIGLVVLVIGLCVIPLFGLDLLDFPLVAVLGEHQPDRVQIGEE